MTSKRYPFLTQQLPFQTTATLRNATRLPEENLDIRYISGNPLLTRVVPKPGGASQEARRLDRVNKVQDELVKQFNVSLAGGLGPFFGRVFRIGHLGDLSAPMVLGCLSAVEGTLRALNVPIGSGAIEAALKALPPKV